MFTPLVYTPKTLPKNTPQELKTDVQILHADRAALEMLVQSILANKRLAWEIVAAWLDANGKALVERRPHNEALCLELWGDLEPKEKAVMLSFAESLAGEKA